jgi:glycerol dehydrogenase-like iron-containing ADH family enzyme
MLTIFITAPIQYISGPTTLDDCGRFIIKWGQNVLVSGGKKALKSVDSKLFPALREEDVKYDVNHFIGECSDENITELLEKVQRMSLDAIIGLGGGKSLDTAKRAAEICDVPVIYIPTIAATCAATSAVSVIYTEKGVHKKDHNLEKNTEIEEVVKFFRQLDLESSFKGLGDDLLRQVAEKATLSESMKNMPFEVLPEQVITAMKQVEEVVCQI